MRGPVDSSVAEYVADVADVPETSASSSEEILQNPRGSEEAGAGNEATGGTARRDHVAMGNNGEAFYGPSPVALPRRAIFVYGTGHVLNDLTAACWFTYLLIFLTDVGLSPKQAGAVMLTGQVADGCATIIVGQLIDGFGHFKLWLAGGSVLVALSFSSVFGGCTACEFLGTKSIFAITVGYSSFAAIFNLGWAATQVSHMSLVNCITANSSSRVSLNSCRNAFSMVSNLALYAIAYVVFWAIPASTSSGVHLQFRWIAWVAIFIGSCFVVIFLLGVREPKLHHHVQECKGTYKKITVFSWFKRLLYHQVAWVYTLTRLTTNVSQALMPFFLVQDLQMAASSKATVPALIYVCSFLASIVLQELHWTGNRLKGVFAGGACLWIISGATIYLLPITIKSLIYAVAAVIGLGNALMLVTATSLQSVVVGHDLSGCAFVYGSLSLMDKLTCGIVLYFISQLNDGTWSCPLNDKNGMVCNDSLFRLSLAIFPSFCSLLAAMITLSMNLGETTPESSLLRRPFLNKEESPTQDRTVEESVPLMRGPRAGSQSLRAVARSIGPPRTGSIHRNKSSADEVENDLEASSSSEASSLSLWSRLESVMVGRWGSLRRPGNPWFN